jgi:hypothetical protein
VLTAAAAQVALARLTTTEQLTVQWCAGACLHGRGGIVLSAGVWQALLGLCSSSVCEGNIACETPPLLFSCLRSACVAELPSGTRAKLALSCRQCCCGCLRALLLAQSTLPAASD